MGRPQVPDYFLDGYADILAEVSVTGRRLTRDELDSRRTLGERAASEGFGLRQLVSRHLAATREMWSGLPGTRGAGGTREWHTTVESVLAATEQVVDAVTEGFERAQLLAVRQEEAERREFVDDLLY